MSQRPGVMLFFDIRPALKRLTIEERGQLFEAILDYGELGLLPDFEGGLGIVWDFIQPRIDQDAERYADKVLKNKYSAYVREAKKADIRPADFETWRTDPDSFYRAISSDVKRYPTTASTPTPTATSTPTPTATATMAAPKQRRSSTEAILSFDEPDFERQRRDALNKFRPFAR